MRGVVLVAECAARIVGAYTLPVGTMVWLGNVIMAGAVVLAMGAGGRLAVVPMERMAEAEAEAEVEAEAESVSGAGRVGRAA